MNTEQERAEFEAWVKSLPRGRRYCLITYEHEGRRYYDDTYTSIAFEAFIAGRAALQSQDREDAGIAEVMREAAQIIAAISPEHAPKNIRWPIVDELEGFASMIDHGRSIKGEGE